MTPTTDEQFATTISGSKPVVVDFFAEWCGPCKVVAPVFERLSTELAAKAEFIKVDIDSSELAPQYSVRGIPTFLILKDGKEVARISGSRTEAALREWIETNV